MGDIEPVVSYSKPDQISGEESESLADATTNSVQTTTEEENSLSSHETSNKTMNIINDNEKIDETDLDSQNNTSNLLNNDLNEYHKTNSSCTTTENNSKQINEIENVEQVIKSNRKRITLIDSDSEDEINPKLTENEDNASHIEDSIEKETHKKRLTLIDSDSDDDKSTTVENNDDIFTESKSSSIQKKKSRLLQLCDSDSEDDTQTENKIVTLSFQTEENVDKEQTFARLKTICDSDSSADETEENIDHISTANIIKQKRTKKNDELTDKPMTGKEALEQRRQIKSESQKMVRETRIHLPYHRPKQHTLQEFLKRKNLLNSTIKAPPNTPTGMSIKILNKNYKNTERKLKEREKEIEEFYKSESEEDEPVKIAQEKEANSTTNSEHIVNVVEKSVSNLEDIQMEIQENISSDTAQVNETVDTLTENTSDDIVEKMIVENQEPVQINETIINDKESVETEKIDEQLVNSESQENTEEKLKEIREILEQNLPKSVHEADTMEVNEIESDEHEQPLQEELLQEQSQQPDDKDEKRKKLLEIENKLKELNPLIALRSNFQPRLSGGPNELIVLDDDIEKSKRVNNLMQRFLKHTAKKQTSKTTEVNIVNVEGGVIHKDTITVVEEQDDDEPAKKFQIPGVKMKKLKMELEDQILQQRMEELKKRQEEMKLNEEDDTYAGEKETCGLSNKLLDNEEEEELTDQSSESESEEEENDIEIRDKPRTKSAFVDEEADESDDEMVEDNEDEENEEQDNEEVEDEESETEELNSETGPKQLRRIIKPVDDSDDETSNTLDLEKQSTVDEFVSQTPHKSRTWEDNDEDIPVYQQQSEKTPCKPASQNKNDLTTFLTPPFHLTALQGMNSASKDSPNVNSYLSPEPSPLKSQQSFKTKLFSDQNEDNLDELENLCSGKFTTQIQTQNDNSKDLSTQENELLNICSGDFTISSQKMSPIIHSLPVKESQSLNAIINDDSQNFKLTIENEKTIEELVAESMKNEQINIQQTTSSSKTPKMIIASSSEDESNKENETSKKKKLKKKRKYIIDDISVSDDEDLEDREDDFEEEEPRNINYDSEENEIEYEEFDEDIGEKPARVAADFLEKEAELSESEWGSEDEDEKNLDDYEVEEGDAEKINEKKVQRELERMHMRNILDKDQHEVKMLQELLLDDGEMHGTGRERKFRWKNADSLSWNEEKPKEEEEECEEIESELHWRKMRHEREMFLKEQEAKKQTQPEEDFMNGSQFLKLGQKALKKSIFGSQHLSQNKTPIAEAISKSDDIKLPFALAIKRGSFLQRSETTLARIAEITKVTGNISGAKNSKNFIFTTVEKTAIIEEEVNIKKRKAEEGTPKALKKIRIADMSPNVQRKKKKLSMS